MSCSGTIMNRKVNLGKVKSIAQEPKIREYIYVGSIDAPQI